MGKPVDVELGGGAGGLEIAGGGGGGGGGGPLGGRVFGAIGRAVSFRCVFVPLPAAGVLVPALFLLVPSRKELGYLSDDHDVLAGNFSGLCDLCCDSRWCEGLGNRGFSWGSSEVVISVLDVVGRRIGRVDWQITASRSQHGCWILRFHLR